MEKNNIKKTMNAFREKPFLFFFSTTIIESGIDVSSANTIIINNAHMFGLSQLHQLGGVLVAQMFSPMLLFLSLKIKTLQKKEKRD